MKARAAGHVLRETQPPPNSNNASDVDVAFFPYLARMYLEMRLQNLPTFKVPVNSFDNVHHEKKRKTQEFIRIK